MDIRILDWLNSHHLAGTIPSIQFISSVATYVSIGSVLLVLIISQVKRSKMLFRDFLILGIALILSALMIQVLKGLFDRERPFLAYPFVEKLSTGGGSSFPSGHTVEAFAMAMAVSLLFRKWWLILPAYLWASLVAYSRLALGVHYPSDVLGGMLIGSVIGWAVPVAYHRISQAFAEVHLRRQP